MKLIKNNPKNASAIIFFYKNKVLLQKRDYLENIFYPGYWGLFGGSKNNNENYQSTVIREIKEEIDYKIDKKNLRYFIKLDLEFPTFKNNVSVKRYFFSYEIKNIFKFKRNLVLREGSDWGFFDKKKCNRLQVTPYDKFALDIFYDRKI